MKTAQKGLKLEKCLNFAQPGNALWSASFLIHNGPPVTRDVGRDCKRIVKCVFKRVFKNVFKNVFKRVFK